MGFIVPYMCFPSATSNVEVHNAYVAIASYGINFRNYNHNLENIPILPESNEELTKYTIDQPALILPGKSVVINYGIWESDAARQSKQPPCMIGTKQFVCDNNQIQDVYTYAYSLLRSSFSNVSVDV